MGPKSRYAVELNAHLEPAAEQYLRIIFANKYLTPLFRKWPLKLNVKRLELHAKDLILNLIQGGKNFPFDYSSLATIDDLYMKQQYN